MLAVLQLCLTSPCFPLYSTDHHLSRAGSGFLWYWLGFLREMSQGTFCDTRPKTKHTIHGSQAAATQEVGLKVSPTQKSRWHFVRLLQICQATGLSLNMALLALPSLGCSCVASALSTVSRKRTGISEQEILSQRACLKQGEELPSRCAGILSKYPQ